MARSRSTMALGLGLLCWIALLFSPLALVKPVQADEVDNYGTVIGIVSSSNWRSRDPSTANRSRNRIWVQPTAVSV